MNVEGKCSKEDLIDELADKFGEVTSSLSYDHHTLRTLLNALVQGNIIDLT